MDLEKEFTGSSLMKVPGQCGLLASIVPLIMEQEDLAFMEFILLSLFKLKQKETILVFSSETLMPNLQSLNTLMMEKVF